MNHESLVLGSELTQTKPPQRIGFCGGRKVDASRLAIPLGLRVHVWINCIGGSIHVRDAVLRFFEEVKARSGEVFAYCDGRAHSAAASIAMAADRRFATAGTSYLFHAAGVEGEESPSTRTGGTALSWRVLPEWRSFHRRELENILTAIQDESVRSIWRAKIADALCLSSDGREEITISADTFHQLGLVELVVPSAVDLQRLLHQYSDGVLV